MDVDSIVNVANAVVGVIGTLGGVLLGFWLSERQETKRRRRLTGVVSVLFREEIGQISSFFSGNVTSFQVTPATRTHDEYAQSLVDIFEEKRAIAIARFYRALSALEIAREEERTLYAPGSAEGLGVTELRQHHAQAVNERIKMLQTAATTVLEVL